MQACSGQRATDEDKRCYARSIQAILKNLDKEHPWPFGDIREYPRSPLELPDHILDHACGKEVRPVAPPDEVNGCSFSLLVTGTPYKKQKTSPSDRLHQTPPEDAIMPFVPAHLHQTTAGA